MQTQHHMLVRARSECYDNTKEAMILVLRNDIDHLSDIRAWEWRDYQVELKKIISRKRELHEQWCGCFEIDDLF